MFSMFTPYLALIKVALVVMFLGGLFTAGYMSGVHQGTDKINAYVAQLQTKITSLQSKNAQSNDKIVTQYVDRVNTVTQKEYVYVKQAQDTVPSQHYLSNGWLYAHDAAAGLTTSDPARASDATPSPVKDNIALATVDSNYAICHRTEAQLIGLQQFVTDYNANVDKVNAGK